MATTKRRHRHRVAADFDDSEMLLLFTGEREGYENPFTPYCSDVRQLWATHGAQFLAWWVEAHPGTRPQAWWQYAAPRATGALWKRYSDTCWQRDLIDGRRLLAGTGRPAWERFCLVPSWRLGVPSTWIGGDVDALRFESQHDYLARHRLLTDGECKSPEPEARPRAFDL